MVILNRRNLILSVVIYLVLGRELNNLCLPLWLHFKNAQIWFNNPTCFLRKYYQFQVAIEALRFKELEFEL